MEWIIILVGFVLIFFATSLRRIPAAPPQVAVVTIFGKRTRQIKKEGYRLFPFYPVVFGAIPISITKVNQDLSPQRVRTHDNAELEITVATTWTPSEDCAIEYLNNNGEAGVRIALEHMIHERLREWARSPGNTWGDVLSAKDEATAALIRDIAGLPAQLSTEDEKQLIKRLRSGDGTQPIASLGITLNRLNIGAITVLGGLASDAELRVREQSKMEAEKVRMTGFKDRVKELMELGLSKEDGAEIVQLNRGDIQKKINDLRGTFSPETIAAILKIFNR
jgi:regulator of protease activity HflC (stomatin/prohibitin superfamily)